MKKLVLTSLWLIFLSSFESAAQNFKPLNRYGLYILEKAKEYKRLTEGNRPAAMVDIRSFLPTVLLDLRYSSANNFMKMPLYPKIQTTYLRLEAAERLKLVQDSLYVRGLGIKIFDAYRPYSVTERMWNMVQDDRYAADPKKGSGHNRGIAVDLTLIDLKTGIELEMGTGFDNFSDSAHHSFSLLPKHCYRNRNLLRSLMEANGFKALETEWWHYSLPNSVSFDLMNLSFAQLKKLAMR